MPISDKSVLVLGWEFPPRMVGGLAIATYGIVEAMSHFLKVHLVIPFKDETTPEIPNVTIYGLNNIEKDFENAKIRKILNKKSTIASFANIHSYPLVFEEADDFLERREERIENGTFKRFRSHLEIFNSPEMYGAGLREKLAVYSEVATELAGLIDFDIIHCHDWVTFAAGKNIKAKYNKPLCLHVHALETDRADKTIRNDIYHIEQSAMQMADLIFPVSQYTKGQIIENYKIKGEKIIPVYNAIDEKLIKRWKHKIPERIVTFLGRITAQKGPEYLFETARKVVAVYPDVKFVIAGTGDQMAQLVAAVADHQLSKHFIFTGFVSREEVDALLATSDVYFMPSVSEPFGLTALEAARAGVPCVLTRQSGAAEVLPSALIADYWNTDLFAEHIVKLLGDEKFRQDIINKNQKEMNKISWYAAAAKVVREYARIL